MSYATEWQRARHEVRCPCCGRHICTEPREVVVLPFRPRNPTEAVTAPTVIKCGGCKDYLEIRRDTAA